MNEPAPPDDSVALRRRPIRARDTRWAHSAAAALTRAGVQPNQISVASVACALIGAAALIGSATLTNPAARIALLGLAAVGIQGRLQCNLYDGLVAVEGGKRTKTGEIYNELPDRISDILLFAAAGYACRGTSWEHELGWAAAALAVFVAYVRALGGQLGTAQQFIGPMAKQQRMALLTLACVTTAAETFLDWPLRSMTWALGLIVLGSVVTAVRRLARITAELERAP